MTRPARLLATAYVTVALPIQLACELVKTNELVQMHLFGPASQGLVIEASSDLLHWIPRYTQAAAFLALDFLDVQATNTPKLFCRITPWR